MVTEGLRLLHGGAATAPIIDASPDPVVFQESCLRAFEASQVARGFAQTTMDNGAGVLERFLLACGRPAWEVTREDVDRVVAGLVGQGLSAATRRGYVQAFKGFHGFPRRPGGSRWSSTRPRATTRAEPSPCYAKRDDN